MTRIILSILIAISTLISMPGLILCSTDDAVAEIEVVGHHECNHRAQRTLGYPAFDRLPYHHDTPMPSITEATTDRSSRFNALDMNCQGVCYFITSTSRFDDLLPVMAMTSHESTPQHGTSAILLN